MVSTDEVLFGKLRELCYPSKEGRPLAKFLSSYVFCAGYSPNLNLPPLPLDPSLLNVHTMLTPTHMAELLLHLKVLLVCNNT